MTFEECRDILLRECELVQEIAGLQNIIGKAVLSRDWTDFEGHFDALGRVKAEFAALDRERERLFAEGSTESLAETGDYPRLYAFASQLPPEQRTTLTDIYRSLKMESLRMQMAGEALMDYIAAARATIADFFEAAFPDRGGKIYTPHGMPLSHDMRSMVLNRAF